MNVATGNKKRYQGFNKLAEHIHVVLPTSRILSLSLDVASIQRYSITQPKSAAVPHQKSSFRCANCRRQTGIGGCNDDHLQDVQRRKNGQRDRARNQRLNQINITDEHRWCLSINQRSWQASHCEPVSGSHIEIDCSGILSKVFYDVITVVFRAAVFTPTKLMKARLLKVIMIRVGWCCLVPVLASRRQ